MNKFKNTITLIAVYITVMDEIVDDRELQIIYNYNDKWEELKKDISDIFSDQPDKIQLDSLLVQLNNSSDEVKFEAFQLFFEVIYSDGFYDSKEKDIITSICKKVHIDKSDLISIESRVSTDIKLYSEKKENWEEKVSLGFYNLIDNLTFNQLESIKKKKNEILLNGPEFVKRIKEIADYSVSDLKLAEKHINDSSNRVNEFIDNLSKFSKNLRQAKRKDEDLDTFTKDLFELVNGTLVKELSENLEVLNKKRKSVNYFTISFLGRTKAGKSTLHSIITKEGDEAIGVGKVRTTRYNRVYNWENLRIIDTPGIGAPNGQSDVQIAESIVDESDLICYLVTNDAIQETEFKFLSEIKKKNKPVIILLNVKENIENKSRRKIFLKDPLKWRNRKDNKSIQGHVERINEYVKKYYHNNFYKVIPVMMLAAKLSETENDEEVKKQLYKASNIDEFLQSIKESVFENGFLRKSQNIIDGSNVRLSSIHKLLSEQKKSLDVIINKLTKEKTIFLNFIDKNTHKYHKNCEAVISKNIGSIRKFAKDFAINHYALNDKKAGLEWDTQLKNRGYLEDLNSNLNHEFAAIQDEIKIQLQEQLDSIQLFFNNASFEIKSASTFNTKSLILISGSTIGVVGSILILALANTNPIGWVVTGVGIVVGFLSRYAVSKEKKIQKAQAKIEESLLKSIKQTEVEYKKQTQKELDKLLIAYKNNVTKNMDEIINNATEISKMLSQELNIGENQIALLNKAMVLRMFQQNGNVKFQKNIEFCLEFDKTIINVKRDFDSNQIEIFSTHQIKNKEQELLSQLLQSEITFNQK